MPEQIAADRYHSLVGILSEVRDEFLRPGPQLWHDLIWGPVEGWPDVDIEAFIGENRGRDNLEWEHWHLWPNRVACGRYYGSGLRIADRRIEFEALASRAIAIVEQLADVLAGGYVAEALIDEDRYFGVRRIEPRGSHAWLELTHEYSYRFPAAHLHSILRPWRYDGGQVDARNLERVLATVATNRTGQPYHLHPHSSSLTVDLFRASAEMIDLWISPELVVPLGEWDGEPISLPELTEWDVPVWDAVTGTLWFQEEVIKRFDKPAENQRVVLNSFEAAGWPVEIRNPFPGVVSADDTLARTIEGLNARHITCGRLHFGTRSNRDWATWREICKD